MVVAHQRLWLGPSGVHGWGAFVKEPVKKHQFIHEYVGEVSVLSAAPLCIDLLLKPIDCAGNLATGSRAPRPCV